MTAKAEIALPRGPQRPILNLGLLCAAGVQRYVGIELVLFARGFGSMNENCLFDAMHGNFNWETCLVP